MPLMTTAMTAAGMKRPSVIEYPTMKTALGQKIKTVEKAGSCCSLS
jgi:hypothetical protein